MARQWKDVGYDVDLETVYWIKGRNLKPASAVEWKQAKYDLTLEELYWVESRNLDPDSAIDWAQAGYDLDLDEGSLPPNLISHPRAPAPMIQAISRCRNSVCDNA